MRRRTAFWFTTLLGIVVCGTTNVREAAATPLLFHLVGYGSGTIDGIGFANAQFSINAIANSEDRQPLMHFDGFTVNNVFANLSIHDLGSGSTLLFAPFDTPTRFFVNNEIGVAGFGHATGLGTIADSLDLFDVADPAFLTWDLKTPSLAFSFDAAHGRLLQWDLAPVLLGGHLVAFDSAPTRGFISTVPEPTLVVLVGAGIAVILRRKTAVRSMHRR